MNQLERVRGITFWGLFAVSSFLSVNLYIGLVSELLDKIIMFTISLTIEGLKVLSLTWGNAYKWQALQYKTNPLFLMKETKQEARSNKVKLLYKRKIIGAGGFFAFYCIAAILSISASLGYTLQTIDYNTSKTIILVDDNSQKVLSKQIELKQRIIKQDEKTIEQYNKQIDVLDTTSPYYTYNFELLTKKISEITLNMTNVLMEEQDLQKQLFILQSENQQVIQNNRKSMYQLMGEAIGLKYTTVMFLLLCLLSFMIEVGLFVCSPHVRKMDEEDKISGENKINSAINKNIVIVPNKLQTELKKEEKTKIILKENNVKEEVLKKEVEKENVPVRVVVEKEKLNVEKFIEALFNNGELTYLKDKGLACDEAKISKIEGAKYFEWLLSTKINGYPIIEYRKESGKWYPNVTSEIAKINAIRVFSKGEINGSSIKT